MLDITINDYMHIKNVKQCVKNTIFKAQIAYNFSRNQSYMNWIKFNLIFDLICMKIR